ncbi:MAG: peptide deformylase [Thermoanaerobaculia bacterium]|nr:peptide deformylase [Thermoanaerobaculia bacterium]
MAIREIKLYPDPVLRVVCPPVERFDDSLEELVDDMVETMYAAPGVGLAAPQIGVEQRVTVVDPTAGEEPDRLHVLVNPAIRQPEGRESDLEGCLSLPGITEKVDRAARITVDAVDVAGNPIELEADGLLARVIQHEIDHLDGVLFVDRLTGLRKERVRRRLKKMRRELEGVAVR